MLDLIKSSMMAGVGLALKAVDEVEDLVKELEKKGKMSEKDGKKFLTDLRKRYDEAQNKLEGKVEKAGKEFFKKVNILTQEDLNGLKKEIRELKKVNIATLEELGALKKEIQALKETTSSS